MTLTLISGRSGLLAICGTAFSSSQRGRSYIIDLTDITRWLSYHWRYFTTTALPIPNNDLRASLYALYYWIDIAGWWCCTSSRASQMITNVHTIFCKIEIVTSRDSNK
jgi:hypothetical protein